ncbi:Basic 7S globulin 2 [Triticum urartu]|uniref:Basic 7S globulin 2 n=1 Tax=Triticum urartu TaxID=4572 RepID=M7ZFY3_TRIUA|nr:Basic 7S globulin 2 [Triticum urartu]
MDRMQKITPNPKNYVVLHRIIVSSLFLLLSCTAASGQQAPYKPLISRLAKDLNTSLYTIIIKADKSPLLLDLAGSLGGFGGKFALCLPVFAIFGDSPVNLTAPGQAPGYVDYTTIIPYTPLLTNPANAAGYYIPVKSISVSWHEADAQAILPSGALELDPGAGTGGVVLSTTRPYMMMRPDVYEPFAKAFDDAFTRYIRDAFAARARGRNVPATSVERVPAPKPFEICYNAGFMRLKRPSAYDVPRIQLELGAGATWKNWTLYGDNYLVKVDGALCLGILRMGPGGMPVDGEPAVVIGAKQLENNLLVFDLEKQVLGFSMLLDFTLSSCTSSNFLRN